MQHDDNLESIVLGSLLVDSDAIYLVIERLNDSDFFSTKHQIIYKGILELFEKGKPIDYLTLMNTLKKSNNLEIVGGIQYLADLGSKVASSANLETHALILKELSIKRKLATKCKEILDKCMDSSSDVFDALNEIHFFADQQAQDIEIKKTEKIVDVIKRTSEERTKKHDYFLPTGFHKLDDAFGGGLCEGLHVIAGRPGMGKTSLALKIGMNVSKEKNVLFISVADMSNEKIAYRCESILSGVPSTRLQKNDIRSDEVERVDRAQHEVSNLNFYLDDEYSDMLKIRSKAKRLHNKEKLSLIVVDYIQQIKGDSDPRIKVSQSSNGLLQLSKELKIPIIAAAQLSRACEVRGGFKKPQLSDLKESGDIEQDAETVTMLYRYEYYGFTEDDKGENTNGLALAMIEKNRNGSVFDVHLNFKKETTDFTNYNLTRISSVSSDDAPF